MEEFKLIGEKTYGKIQPETHSLSVSTEGRLKYEIRKRGELIKSKFLKQYLDRDGYKRWGYKNYEWIVGSQSSLVHRVMAKAFLEDYSEDLTVNHKDLNKKNNNIENLEMMPFLDNLQHAVEIYKQEYIESEEGQLIIKCIESKKSLKEISKLTGYSSAHVWMKIERMGLKNKFHEMNRKRWKEHELKQIDKGKKYWELSKKGYSQYKIADLYEKGDFKKVSRYINLYKKSKGITKRIKNKKEIK